PRPRSPERTRDFVANLHALSVGAMARRAAIVVDRFALRGIELLDRNERGGLDGVLAAPRWTLPHLCAARQPRQIRRDRKHFGRRRRGKLVARELCPRRVLAAQETI